jgi:DNA-binding transcriptional ArsR family regulator
MALSVKKLDGRSLRALAHPLRMRIVGSLRHDGPATATLLGQRLGESSGLTSYHVRVLAENGFVEEASDVGTGRERWWQAAQDMTSWRPEDFRDDPDEREAEEWLTGYAAGRGMEWLDEWLHRRPSADPDWVTASDASDYTLDLTPAELRALATELSDVVLRHRDASLATEPEGRAERQSVRVLVYAFPRPPEEQHGQAAPPARRVDGEADDG